MIEGNLGEYDDWSRIEMSAQQTSLVLATAVDVIPSPSVHAKYRVSCASHRG
jgi:hypothetical protein